ncbi:MAG: hypothetical protein Q9187_001411 [Circinaria calcarea]
MSKRTVFTTLTPLPAGISRETVIGTLQSHVEMIDLNPLVIERHPIKPPANATAEEFNYCDWYQLTDKVQYMPGGLYSGKVSYNACFHNLSTGLQTHVYAPMGLDIKGKWTLGGSLPGEPREAVEMGLGAPKEGLWLREDVDMRCNVFLTSFVKKTLKKSHLALVARLVEKAHLLESRAYNNRLNERNRRASPSIYSANSPESPGYQNHLHAASLDPRSSISTFQTGKVSLQSSTSDTLQNVDPAYQNFNLPYQNLDPAYQPGNPYFKNPIPYNDDRPAELHSTPRPLAFEME